MTDDDKLRLLHVLHRGLDECRNLAMACDHPQLTRLTDILELIPRVIAFGKDDDVEILMGEWESYCSKYATSNDYYYMNCMNVDPGSF